MNRPLAGRSTALCHFTGNGHASWSMPLDGQRSLLHTGVLLLQQPVVDDRIMRAKDLSVMGRGWIFVACRQHWARIESYPTPAMVCGPETGQPG